MIRISKKNTIPVPEVLKQQGAAATDKLMVRYEKGERSFTQADFDRRIYAHKDVKIALMISQYNKCCFCESKINHTSYGDVEHFRPKAAWSQDRKGMFRPGYYWLCYSWDNLLLSCQICNQRFKGNFFPLRNEARALSHHHAIEDEEPLFIHPVLDDPELFITFREDILVAIDDNERGVFTISCLGLHREALQMQRKRTFNMIRDIYDIAKGIPYTVSDIKQQARKVIRKYYEDSLLDETEYAAMRRAFFREYPVDF
jgi:uncharacterized protein (TIGR02646 family)